jgi:arginyl-tRNA--protein-N-Asp/Glu arginylyltransferase
MNAMPLYLSGEYDCDYLPGRRARMVYVAPSVEPDKSAYSWLAARGFRRSGTMVYRPHCRDCRACVPVRIAVDRFRPSRAQRRVLRRNSDLSVVRKPPAFDEAHYRLFARYLQARHPDGQMTESTPEDYLRFVAAAWGETAFYEFRRDEALLAVAVVDHLADGLSAVYTFYDPDVTGRSLGTYAVLWQVLEAERLGLRWVYLGFWISACRKMAYKDRFRPLQAFDGDRWVTMDKGENAAV